MSWRRLGALAFLLTLLIFAGVASGQGRYELPDQGPQPLKNDLQEQGPQPLQGDLDNLEQPGLVGPQSIDASLEAAAIKKSAKGAAPKPYAFGTDPGKYGPPQASRLVGSNLGPTSSTSFLDGYFLKSLGDKKPAAEDKFKEDLLLPGKTSSKFLSTD